MLSTKKRYSSFLEKALVPQKICFEVKVLISFKISSLCHIKTYYLANGGLFWKSLVPLFRRIYALPFGFKMKPLRKSIFQCWDKTNPNFVAKLAERSNHSFLLSIWWIAFFKHLYSLIRIIECIERNWSCKRRKKGQKQPSNHSCTELSEIVFPCEYR